MHWRQPVFVQRVDDDQGPVLVTVEYRVDPADREQFLEALAEIGLERKRDGAYAWFVFEDAAIPGRIVETFLVQSLLELKHLRQRVTQADRLAEQCAHRFLREDRKVTFMVAPKRVREKRRRKPAVFSPAPQPAE